MLLVSSYTGTAFPSPAFLDFFQASGVDSAVFARASVLEGVWSDVQLLTTELFQRLFHILGWLRVRKGKRSCRLPRVALTTRKTGNRN